LSEAGIDLSADDVVAHLEQASQTPLGESRDILPEDLRKIPKICGLL
jgi:hypothetical protein